MSRRKIFLSILILFWFGQLTAQIDTVVVSARNFFAEENYRQGFLMLTNHLSANLVLDSLSKAKIQYEVAKFYEQHAGDFDKSLAYYQQITKSRLPKNNPLFEQAEKKEQELLTLFQKYKNVDAEFSEFKSLTHRQNEKAGYQMLISGLKKIMYSNPDFYRKAEIHYLLGVNYTKLDKYGKANRYFRKALKEKPAIDYLVPLSINLKDSVNSYKGHATRKFSTIFLGIFLLFTIILFYRAKPWNWYSWKHLILLPILMILWAALYFPLFYIFGKSVGNFHLSNDTFQDMVVFLFVIPGDPGSQPVWLLFIYGLYAILGLYLFSIGIYVFRSKWLKNIILPVVGLLLFLAASSVFYAKNVHNKVAPMIVEGPYLQKSYLYALREIEPYMLTNPKAFPNLDVGSITSEVLIDWIMEHCPFDENPEAKESSENKQ